jgi:predicted nucleic acid-binding protein
MIILDTNVLSEFTHKIPVRAVLSWFERQNLEELWTTAITEAEMLAGLALLPNGRRKDELARSIANVLGLFEYRILPFDRDAAARLPEVAVERRLARLKTHEADGFIAAIARAHNATLATRNVRDFAHCGIKVIDPWNSDTQ